MKGEKGEEHFAQEGAVSSKSRFLGAKIGVPLPMTLHSEQLRNVIIWKNT